MIALGATEISKVCHGSDELSKVCLGSTELWSAAPTLPYDAEIEYIGSNSPAPAIYQWIDTGIVPEITDIIHIKVGPITTYPVSASSLFLQQWAVKCFFIQINKSSANTVYWHGMNPTSNQPLSNDSVNDIVCGNGFITINGTTYSGSDYLTQNNNSIILFNNTSARRAVFDLYLFEVIRNGVVIACFKPVRVGSEGCLYETVSGQLFHNGGSGSFTIGPDKTGA